MIRGGFLSVDDRNKLIALARDGSAASRVTRRANALVLLDNGWSCYGRYSPSAMHSAWKYVNATLIAWAMRKYKRYSSRIFP